MRSARMRIPIATEQPPPGRRRLAEALPETPKKPGTSAKRALMVITSRYRSMRSGRYAVALETRGERPETNRRICVGLSAAEGE